MAAKKRTITELTARERELRIELANVRAELLARAGEVDPGPSK